MLSRDADTCYWIGRYVERAEATARMVDVHYHAALESILPYVNEAPGEATETPSPVSWQSILAISGRSKEFHEKYGAESDHNILQFFAFDLTNPDSIMSTWTGARENARSIRDMIASEMWEAINISYLEFREWDVDRVLRTTPHEFFHSVKNASHLFQGILNRTMMMGEAREWLDTGRFLERGCQTARLLDVKYHDLLPATLYHGDEHPDTPDTPGVLNPYGVGGPLDMHGWIAVLKSVSAFEMYCKTHRDGINPTNVVDFLVLNPSFPASVRHGVGRVEACLRRISGAKADTPATEPERIAGRLRADLTYTSPREIIAGGLHNFLGSVLSQCNTIGASISRTFLS